MSSGPHDSLVPTPAPTGPFGVVLFDLPGDRLPALAADLRRLGRRPPEFRWLSTGDDESDRVLVRVEGPPPLLVWRVLDESEGAYVEQVPGIWVRVGYRHPHADRLRRAADHILLIRPDHTESVPAGEFVGEIESLPLPAAPVAYAPGSPSPPVAARLRLLPAPDHEPARLWVLREDALHQLTTYCRAAHQQLLGRFTVAVSASAGVPAVVLRAVTAKGPPPVFVGPAVAYGPLLKLPNLYLPAGTRLAPTLRRDALRAAFGLTPDRVVWLHPLGGGGFRAESLPESAFHPLTDWVEYKLADPPHLHAGWAQSHRWDFEPFVERPDPKPRTARAPTPAPEPVGPTPAQPRPRRGLLSKTLAWLKKLQLPPPGMRDPHTDSPEEPNVPVEEAMRRALGPADRLHLARPEAASAALDRCRTLEARFLHQLPNLDPEGQTDRWAELAAAYDAAGNHADAALCWLNALWGQPRPSPLWAWGWLRAEAKAARPEVRSIDPVPWLAAPPGPGSTRAMAAWVVWAAAQTPSPAVLRDRAADLQARLEAHEHWLPVRAAWLARTALARRGSGDVLGLARTRDRLAERLLAGLSLERDTPSFLRFAGEGVRERFQEARRWLADRRELIHQWIARLPEDATVRPGPVGAGPVRREGLEPNVSHTRGYADLVLAWGLARFAEHTAAENARKHGVAALPADDPAHAVLREAFEFRIAQVREGKPPRGPLPPALRARIDRLDDIPRYAVHTFRQHSRILEPTARVDGYREYLRPRAAVGQPSPAAVVEGLPADRLDEEVERLLAAETARDGKPHLAELVSAVLDRAFELTEAGAGPVLAALPPALDTLRDSPARLARLIERGLAAAALWDRADVARDLAGWFFQLAYGRAGWDMAEALTGQAFRSLRRLGLRAEADRVLHYVAERVLQGQPISRLREARVAEWPATLRVLLHAAAGWYYAGTERQADDAHQVLDEARRDLFDPDTTPANRTELALVYATTLAQAPARIALGRLEELFQRLRGVTVGGTFNAYYSLKPLLIVEAAVRAVVSDDFALGPQVRAWLDADELAVRRRIRDELKEVLAGQGL